MLAPPIVKFKQVLRPESHLSDDFAVRTGKLPPSYDQPAFIYHGGPRLHQLHRPEFPVPPRWELSTVPPRPTIYFNRVGLDPDLPLTRLPVHNPQTAFTLFPFFTQRL